MANMPDADAVIIGAGPAGLFAAFQLGLHGVHCLIIDSDTKTGGQCAALYADKPVYDMPGFAEVNASAITDKLKAQAERFSPKYRLGDLVLGIEPRTEGGFAVDTRSGQRLFAPYVILATGLGPFGDTSPRQVLALPEGVSFANGHVDVTQESFETCQPGLFAIGDVVSYPGKLCLLVSAFHEAALMAFAIRRRRAGERRVALEYSSTSSAMKSLFTAK